MHLLSPFSLNLPLYEHKKRPSYMLEVVPESSNTNTVIRYRLATLEIKEFRFPVWGLR